MTNTNAKGSSKVILITGASSGMGRVTAEHLAQDGHTVYGAARNTKGMDQLVKFGGHALQADVTKDADLQKVVQHIMEAEGRIDVLVNNAGFGLYGAVEDISIEEARYQFEVNLFGLARLTQLVTPHMRKRRSGKIINISSMGGKMYTPLGAWYHASKHALEGFSDCLRIELEQFGIDVVVVEPGEIATNFGNVLTNPMVERSKGGAYQLMAESLASALSDSFKEGSSTSPVMIYRTIAGAIAARRPKTRYLIGKFAKPMVFIRKWFGDRIFDKVLMAQIKRMQPKKPQGTGKGNKQKPTSRISA